MDPETAEPVVNGNGHKDILAPAEGPRESLITTAVKFLQHPKVSSSPLYQKKAFLEKKGLTAEEITLAIQRAGVTESQEQSQVVPAAASQALLQQHVPPPQYLAPIPPQSGWAKVRDLTLTTVIVASVSYGMYQLFQKYIRPLLVGKSEQEKRLERLETQIADIHKSVAESLTDINLTLASIKASLNNQQSSAQGQTRGVTDLKADIASLKGLLLSRSQFPPTPSAAPVLPSWQRNPTTAAGSSATTKMTNGPTEFAAASVPSDVAESEASADTLQEGAKPEGDFEAQPSDESEEQDTSRKDSSPPSVSYSSNVELNSSVTADNS